MRYTVRINVDLNYDINVNAKSLEDAKFIAAQKALAKEFDGAESSDHRIVCVFDENGDEVDGLNDWLGR